jgi:hypothetical protein
MKHNPLLTIMSLLSMLLTTLHITDDIARGISPARADNMGAVVIFLVWLIGTLLLAERRLGYVIMFLGGLFAAAMPVLHMRGTRYGAIATSSGGFFFVWTLIVVGSIGAFTVILAARALWNSRSGKGTSREWFVKGSCQRHRQRVSLPNVIRCHGGSTDKR